MNIKKSFKHGFAWSNLANIYQAVLQFIVGIYLARTIEPHLFGQSALVKATIALFFAFMMFGARHAILRQKDDVIPYMSMQMALRILAMGIITAIAAILTYFDLLGLSKELYFAFWLLFLSHVAVNIATIYFNYMHKQFLFGRRCLLQMISITCAVVVASVLAYSGSHFWALIWLMAADQFMRAFLMVLLVPKRFMPRMNIKLAKEFYDFGKYVFLSNVIGGWRAQLDRLAIGHYIGTTDLGFYGTAHSFVAIFQKMISTPLQSVCSPIIAAVRDDRERLARFLFVVLKTVVILALGSFVFLAFVMPQLIIFLYGAKWLPSVGIYRALVPCFVMLTVQMILFDFQLIDGSSKSVFIARMVSFIVLLLVMYPLIEWKGIIGAALAVDCSVILGSMVLINEVKKSTGISFTKIVLCPLVITLFTYFSCSLIEYVFNVQMWSIIIQLLIKSLCYALMFGTGLYLFERKFIIKGFKLLFCK